MWHADEDGLVVHATVSTCPVSPQMEVLPKLRKKRAAQRRADRRARAIERRNLRRAFGDDAFPLQPTEARDMKAGEHGSSSSDSDGGA